MTENPPQAIPIESHSQKLAPLSFAQESLWFLQQLDPGNNAYNSNYHLRFSGGIDHPTLEKALNEIVQRHESLRTFYPNKEGKPVQVVQEYKPFTLPFVDFSHLGEEERQKSIHKYIVDHGDKPFDLLNGPLNRCAFIRLSKDESLLFFSTHHINSDAWSRQVFVNQLMILYHAFRNGEPANLPPLPIQYTDYALWQREWLKGDILKAFVDHWKKNLSGDLPILDLPTDRPRPILQTFHGNRYRFPLAQPLVSQIKAFCQSERITFFHFLMAAYFLLLMRHTGQEDIIMGCPFANRPSPELENMVGLFVNTLPIRLNLESNPTVRKLVNQVRDTMADAFTWQAVPFEAIVSEISPERDLSRTPVFQVAINLRNIPNQPAIPSRGIEAKYFLREDAPAPFDLSLEFDEEAGAFMASFQYNADLFDEQTIIQLTAHYQHILRDFLSKPDAPISEIEMLTPSEINKTLYEWNDNKADFPQVCVQELFSDLAKQTPESIHARPRFIRAEPIPLPR